MHRRFRIGLPQIHRRFPIGPPKIHRWFRIGHHQATLNLLLPEFHSRWILVYYVRKATKLPLWNRMLVMNAYCISNNKLLKYKPKVTKFHQNWHCNDILKQYLWKWECTVFWPSSIGLHCKVRFEKYVLLFVTVKNCHYLKQKWNMLYILIFHGFIR